jgi:hypothetical protein
VNRRTLIEIGLLVAGVVLGAGALLYVTAKPAPPEAPPEPVPPTLPSAVTTEWPTYRGDPGLTGRTSEKVPDAPAWTRSPPQMLSETLPGPP